MAKLHAIVMTAFGTILTLAGCGGGMGGPVTLAPERYEPIRLRAQEPFVMEFPGQGGFGIHTRSSEQNPGQDGTADSAADANAQGTALCRASGSDGGSSSSTFTLGAAMRNDGAEPFGAAVTCDIEYEYAVRTTAETGGRQTSGQVALDLQARDVTTGKLLFQHGLAGLTGYEEDLRRTDQQRVQFTTTVLPKARWQIVLVGKAWVETVRGGRAQVDLRVHRCRMVVAAGPGTAPATQAAQ